MKRYIAFLAGIIILLLSGITYIWFQNNHHGRGIDQILLWIIQKDKADEGTEIIDTVHQMANTRIISKDGEIWGTIEITSERCDELIERINKYKETYPDDVRMINCLDILNRWKAGDFSQVVNDHNDMWNYLGGTVGEAIRAK